MNFNIQVIIWHCTCTRLALVQPSSDRPPLPAKGLSSGWSSFLLAMTIKPIEINFRSRPEIVSEGICRLLLDAPWLSGCLLHHCCGPAKINQFCFEFWLINCSFCPMVVPSSVILYCKWLPSHTGQEQACTRITRLFVCSVICHHAKNGPIHRKMVATAP